MRILISSDWKKINGDQLFCTDTLLHNVFDSVCNGCWGYGAYTNVSGYAKKSMLYFKTNRFGYVNSTVIYSADTAISDITMHTLYYLSPYLAITHDTVYLNVVVAHLKSGSSGVAARTAEVAGAMSWLDAHISGPENIIFMGDLNTTKSTENCFKSLVNSTNMDTRFYDPPNQLGNWSSIPYTFALYLTQSTRTTDPGDCSSTGGLGNRYDHMLMTSPILNGTHSIQYLSGSYQVIGQDGNHTGIALIDSPSNTSVPPNVNDALYYMSEHLPVAMHLKISYASPAGVTAAIQPPFHVHIYPNPAKAACTIEATNKIAAITVYSLPGEKLFTTVASKLNEHQSTLNLTQFPKGIYFIQITDVEKNVVNAKLVLE